MPNPIYSVYAKLVSRITVRITFTYVVLLGLDLWSVDIVNTFDQTPTIEKYWVGCGPEFGITNIGKKKKVLVMSTLLIGDTSPV